MICYAYFTLCPKFEAAVELIGKRWTGLIIRVLLTGPKSFNELTNIISLVSGKMLTVRLKEFENAGMIKRMSTRKCRSGLNMG